LFLLLLPAFGFRNDWREALFNRKGADLGLYGYELLDEEGKFFKKYRDLPFDDPPVVPPGVSFSGIFTNNTVLQMQPLKATLYGNAPPNANVNVALSSNDYNEKNSVKVDGSGVWKIILKNSRPAGGNYTLTASCDKCSNTEVLINITFGDVWYCSGQSNMELPVHNTVSRNQTWDRVKNGELQNIRLYQMSNYNIQEPMFVVPKGAGGTWKLVTNDEFMVMSAVCWYFAQELTGMLGNNSIPIGLIDTAVGGSMIEQWNANHTMPGNCNLDADWPAIRGGKGGNVCHDKPEMCGGLYNGLLAPFQSSTIKGLLWYQGENNMHEYHGNWYNNTGYGCLFKMALKNWRSDWNRLSGTTDPNFPVGVVTLAQGTDEAGPDMAGMRWAQTLNYGYFPNPECTTCFSAQAYDLGDPWNGQHCWAGSDRHVGNNRCSGWSPLVPFSSTVTPFYMGSIHPRVKLEVGRRLAISAFNMFYGGKGPMTGPVLKSCSVQTKGYGDFDIEMEFDQDMMNPHGINNQAGYRLSVMGDYHRGQNLNLGGPLTVNSEGDWVGVSLKGMWDDNGKILASYQASSKDLKQITGLRYAWDNPEITCCPTFNTAIFPCMPRSCPAYMKYNVTTDPSNAQVGLESGRPINPFWAQIKWNNDTHGECSCFAPQKCDGSSQLKPIIEAAEKAQQFLQKQVL